MMYRPIWRNLKPNNFSPKPVPLLILYAFILLLFDPSTSSQSPKFISNGKIFSTKLTNFEQDGIQVMIKIEPEPPFPEQLMIAVKYQPQSIALPIARQVCMSVPYKDKPADIDVQCNSSIEFFGYYDDPLDSYSPFLKELCAPKTIPLKPTFSKPTNTTFITQTIRGLQSNVIYIVRVSIILNHTELDYSEHCIHTKDQSPPQYPPQTDLSSFQIKDELFGSTEIALFWRPIPGVLAGNTLTEYQVDCTYATIPDQQSRLVFTKANISRLIGFILVKLDLRNSYTCTIKAYNNHGESTKKSVIYIPQKSQIFNETIDLQVSALTANKYILQWMKLNDTFSSLYPEMNLSDSYYTLYWCLPAPGNYSCTSIEGMKKTRKTIEEIVINKADTSYRLFGVSYTVPQSKYSSGISWSNECLLGKLKSPYSDITSVQSDPTGTQLIVTWREKCDPIKALIVGFKFELFKMSNEVISCFDDVEKLAMVYDSSTKFVGEKCNETSVFKYKRPTEAIFTNLSPGHLYRVSMTVILQNNTQIPYQNHSDSRYASTTNPRCLPSSNTFFSHLASLLATITVSICIFGWFYGHYARYRKAARSLTKVLDEKLEIVSSIDSFDYKYLINRSSSHAQSSIISNPTLTVSFDSSGEPSTAICVSDYVPVNQTDTDHLLMMDEDRPPSPVEDISDNSWNVEEKHCHWSSFDVSESDSITNLCGDTLDSDCDDDSSLDSHSSFLHKVLQLEATHEPTEMKTTNSQTQ